MTGFVLAVDEDVELVLTEPWLVPSVHALLLADLEHLQPWEELARPDLTLEEFAARLRTTRLAWVDGKALPCTLRWRGEVVGALGARLDPELSRAGLGYWIDAGHQGRGIVTRAAATLREHLVRDRGVQRVEIRCAAQNRPSRAVAERLGFTLEGTLRSVLPAAGGRHDVCVCGRLPGDDAHP